MKRPCSLDPTEFKLSIRHLNDTDKPQLNAVEYSNSITFFEDIQTQRLLEIISFRITKLNTFHYGAFARKGNSQLASNSTFKEKTARWDRYE